MPLYVDACRLVHVNGAKKHKWVTISTESKMLGLAGEYSRFDLAHGVSREHARIMTPDNFSSIWVEDQKSRKGTYLCIGGVGQARRDVSRLPRRVPATLQVEFLLL